MFERIQLAPSMTLDNDSTPTPATNKNSSMKTHWKFHKKTPALDMQLCPLNDTDRACDLYESCMANLTSFVKAVSLKKTVNLLHNDDTSPNSYSKLQIAFGIGLGVGVLFGTSFMFVILTLMQMCSTKRSSRLRRRNAIRDKSRGRGSRGTCTGRQCLITNLILNLCSTQVQIFPPHYRQTFHQL